MKFRHPAIVHMTVDDLVPYQGNARTHSRRQIAQIAGSIELFGFINPVVIDGSNQIIAGHGRIAAAKKLGLTSVPTLRIEHLSGCCTRIGSLPAARSHSHSASLVFWKIGKPS